MGGRGCALFLGSPFAQLEQAFQVAVNTTLGAMSMEPNRKEVEDYINKVRHVLHSWGPTTPPWLYLNFALQAFDLPEQVRAKLWDKAKHKQVKSCYL